MITFKMREKSSDGLYEYISSNGKTVTGICEFFMSPEQIDILDVQIYDDNDRRDLSDGLVRSALFAAESRGVKKCRFAFRDTTNTLSELTALGFKKSEELGEVSKCLDGHCKHSDIFL